MRYGAAGLLCGEISVTIVRILALFQALLLSACTNIGLLDKLENPGGGALYVFVSSISTLGDTTGLTLGSCGSIGVGIARADCACTEMARAGGLLQNSSGRYVAWLSDQNNDMTCRIFGISGNNCGTSGGRPWYNTVGEQIAGNVADLLDANLNAPLKYTEFKNVSSFTSAWTGTDANGLRTNAGAVASNCSGWTALGTGSTGTIGTLDAFWSNNAGVPSCSGAGNPIYCFAVP